MLLATRSRVVFRSPGLVLDAEMDCMWGPQCLWSRNWGLLGERTLMASSTDASPCGRVVSRGHASTEIPNSMDRRWFRGNSGSDRTKLDGGVSAVRVRRCEGGVAGRCFWGLARAFWSSERPEEPHRVRIRTREAWQSDAANRSLTRSYVAGS